MEPYAPIFTITPEILNSAYEIATDLERIDINQNNKSGNASAKLSNTQEKFWR